METLIAFSVNDVMRKLPSKLTTCPYDEKIVELSKALKNDALGIWNYSRRIDAWDHEDGWEVLTNVDELRDDWDARSIIIFKEKKHLINLDEDMKEITCYIAQEDAQRRCQELDAVEQLKKDLNILWQNHLYDEKIIGFHLTDNKKIERILKGQEIKQSKNVFLFDHRNK